MRGVAELLADLLGPRVDRTPSGPARRGRRCRSRSGRSRPARPGRRAGRSGRGGSCGPTRWRTSRTKFCAAPGRWKPTTSAPSRPSRSCRRQGSCWNSSAGGNGMCRKKPIRRSGRSSRSIAGHQLHLVVVHPDRGALGGDLGGLLGEPPVDARRRRPTTRGGTPAWRPRRGRAATGWRWRSPRRTPRPPRALSGTGTSESPSSTNGSSSLVGAARPADPGAVVLAHHRLDGGDQAAGRAAPGRPSRRSLTTRSTGSRLATMTRSAWSWR